MDGYGLRDAALSVTGALPGATANADIGDIDLETTSNGDFVAGCELVVQAPALTTGELPDGAELTVNVTQSDDDFATEEVVANDVVLATGSGGAGAPASEARVRMPTDVKREIRINVANSGAGDPSAKSATTIMAF